MNEFKIHTKESAPEGAKEILTGAENKLGFVPNLFGIMSEAPSALKAYTGLSDSFEKSSFSATEKQIVLLATSNINGCHYCMAVHSTLSQMNKIPQDIIESLRDNKPINDSKLEALRQFTIAVVEKRGWVSEEDKVAFITAGYSYSQILEVLVGVAQKTLSNYTSHIADTPLDSAFEANKWEKSEVAINN